MNAFLVCVSRWMVAAFWVFGALQQSESAVDCKIKPENPKIVVLGVDSDEVSLNWKTCEGDASETIRSFSFFRQRPGSVITEQIASRDAAQGFTMIAPFQDKKKYEALLNQELKIYNVQRDEEYVYTLEIDYRASSGALLEEPFRVTVDVKVPPKITTAPTREVQLSLSSSSVQNHTMKCNASGDPHPNITWTKDGIPASQFNASGYFLHLVNVQKEDAGSYICTADNGFGNATAIGIVNIRCPDCETERVGIRILDVTFKQPFENQASTEFKSLESQLLSAIWGAYADNLGKQLHSVDVDEFRDGSVYAIVELKFGPSVSDPLGPLREEMKDRNLGSFTVDSKLDVNPTTLPATASTETTTGEKGESATTGAPGSGLTPALWGVIGACIAVVIIVVIVILVCCIYQRRGKNNRSASKGAKYSEADGYRMNRQPPPSSGLGTASPAYVEASQYARRQDDQSKPPLNYADVSVNNSSGPGRQPPPYSGTEYSEMSPEKRPPPAGGQKGEGGGFELWC